MAQAKSSRIESFRKEIHAFVKQILDDYPDRLPHKPREKFVNDPIWKTIVVRPFEVLLLDSPLLQRLRSIRQLGVVHLVYPAATHTRFEHSLGVLCQVQRLIDAINSRGPKANKNTIIDGAWENLLRLAGLCHDIGHGVMSHVSENALDQFPDVEEMLLTLAQELGSEKPSLSEATAYFMLGSPAFRDLFEKAEKKVRDHDLPENCIDLMRKAILGQPIRDDVPLMHEIISGPFDADKLDYMTRDATMTGVPIVTDIVRLTHKVGCIAVSGDSLPTDLAGRVDIGHPQYSIFGIALSAGRALDELMLGRAFLFDKLYRHHKVRAAESMIAALFNNIATNFVVDPEVLPYKFHDADLLDADVVANRLHARPDELPKVARDLCRRLNHRQLFVRGFAFAQKMPHDPFQEDDTQRAGLGTFISHARDAAGARTELHSKIVREVEEIIRILEISLNGTINSNLGSYICLDPPAGNSPGKETHNAFLISGDNRLVRFREDTAEARSWVAAYLLARDLGYIFCDPEIAEIVYLAAEKICATEYGVCIPETMITYAKRDRKVIDQNRRLLFEKGYYDNCPLFLEPVPERLMRVDVKNRLERVLSSLGTYDGPRHETDTVGKIQPKRFQVRIWNWLRTWRNDALIEDAITLLENVKLIGRDSIVATMRQFLEKNPTFQNASVCPLGEPRDSSSICTYFVEDLAVVFPDIRVRDLGDALMMTDKPIIFVDDLIGSGRQSVDILQSLLSLEREHSLDEVRNALSPNAASELRQRSIAFVFAAGLDEGENRLTKFAVDEGLSAIVHLGVREKDLPRAFGMNGTGGLGLSDEFRDKCREMGDTLLDDGNPKHDENWRAERVLGYGNRSLLVLFPYNTPTQTLTCLWATKSESRVQAPFPRRKKR